MATTRPVLGFDDHAESGRGAPMGARRLARTAIAIALLSVAAGASAKDLYVAAATGSDGGAGSSADPWKTIGKAASVAAAGDTVHVAPGSYPEIVTTDASGTAASPIVFVSDVRWGAELVGPPHVSGGPVAVWTVSGDHVDIVGFDVTGGPRVGILVEGSFVRTIHNRVHDMKADWDPGNGGAGIDDGNYSAHDDDMIGNVVHDIGPPGESTGIHGLYHSNLRGRIVNNLTYRNSGWGIHTWHAPKDVVIANNLVFENRSGGIIVGAGDAPGTGVADGFLVTNNIVVHNYARAGIIEYGSYGPGNRYVDNLVWSNPVGAFAVVPATKISGTVDADPTFVNYDALGNAGDYHLLAGSPAIDTGASASAPTDDIEGVLRPQGAAWDLGPYEWVAPGTDAGVVVDSGRDAAAGPDAAVDAARDGSPVADVGGADGSVLPDGSDGSVDGPASAGASSGCGCVVGGANELPGGLGASGLAAIAGLVASRRRARRR